MDPDWFRDPPTLYYHPDHLGSTSFASNNEQTLTQRDEYFPSGELWIDASDSRYELRRAYVFTGKELDQATGLYYFGARYYDPRMSVWLSPDPILDEYMQGGPGAGVFNPSARRTRDPRRSAGAWRPAGSTPSRCSGSTC
ncbi:RHS repeat-associated core domain-containing protein [Sorangium sp. So ce118]